MRSLITGGAGFVGSHVAQHCLELGHRVTVIDDLSGGFRENVPAGAIFAEGSVTDAEFVRTVFKNDHFDYVYHLAAYAAEGLSHFIRRFNYTNNVIGSVNLVNESIKQGVKCFVFTSSIAVYGSAQVPMTEDQIPQPEDPYGVSKYAVEMDLACAKMIFGLPHVIFRPHNVYGERQNISDRYRNVIGIFMNQLLRKEPMTIFGDGMQMRAFSHIDDIAPQIAQSVHVPRAINETFNIGASTPHTVLDLAYGVAKAFGVAPQVEFLPPRNEVVNAYADHKKALKVFGSHLTVSLEEGLNRMAKWAMALGPQVTRPFAEIEVANNMPSVWIDPR